MNIYRPRHGVPGELSCVLCFESSCFGCALMSPPVGKCPICGADVMLDEDFDWLDDEPVHEECRDAWEKETTR